MDLRIIGSRFGSCCIYAEMLEGEVSARFPCAIHPVPLVARLAYCQVTPLIKNITHPSSTLSSHLIHYLVHVWQLFLHEKILPRWWNISLYTHLWRIPCVFFDWTMKFFEGIHPSMFGWTMYSTRLKREGMFWVKSILLRDEGIPRSRREVESLFSPIKEKGKEVKIPPISLSNMFLAFWMENDLIFHSKTGCQTYA